MVDSVEKGVDIGGERLIGRSGTDRGSGSRVKPDGAPAEIGIALAHLPHRSTTLDGAARREPCRHPDGASSQPCSSVEVVDEEEEEEEAMVVVLRECCEGEALSNLERAVAVASIEIMLVFQDVRRRWCERSAARRPSSRKQQQDDRVSAWVGSLLWCDADRVRIVAQPRPLPLSVHVSLIYRAVADWLHA
ncbi:MAG: hypothetical protein Q9157_006218 [Trypethelium eluteriae]